jgi:hypothetical protein
MVIHRGVGFCVQMSVAQVVDATRAAFALQQCEGHVLLRDTQRELF